MNSIWQAARTGKTRQVAIREGKWTLVNVGNQPNWQLFDVTNDYSQTKNIAGAHPEVVARLNASYDAWWAKTLPLMVNEDAAGPTENSFHTLFYQQFPDQRPKPNTAQKP